MYLTFYITMGIVLADQHKLSYEVSSKERMSLVQQYGEPLKMTPKVCIRDNNGRKFPSLGKLSLGTSFKIISARLNLPSESISPNKPETDLSTEPPAATPEPRKSVQKAKSPQGKVSKRRNSWEDECLSEHNIDRAKSKKLDGQSIGSLSWNDTLRAHAKIWADVLAKENNGLRHSSEKNWGHGENLYSVTLNGDLSCKAAIKAFFDEYSLYNNEKIGEGDYHKWGHFTQVRSLNSLFLAFVA